MANKLFIRVIPEVLKLNGPMTMAAHEFLTTLSEPALMLSHFNPGTVTIGKAVTVESLPEICRTLPVVRRETGGEVLWHEPSDVTYAFSGVPEGSSRDVTRATLLVMSWLMDGLDSLGIKTWSNAGTSIFVNSDTGPRKIAGSAVQKNLHKPYLVHGSIFYDSPDLVLLEKLYGIHHDALGQKITCVRDQKNVEVSEVYRAVRHGFLLGRTYHEKSFSEDEWKKIEELSAKYASAEHLNSAGSKRGKGCAVTWGDHSDKLKHLPDNLKGRTIYDLASTKAI